jgi:hypothetical protein
MSSMVNLDKRDTYIMIKSQMGGDSQSDELGTHNNTKQLHEYFNTNRNNGYESDRAKKRVKDYDLGNRKGKTAGKSNK